MKKLAYNLFSLLILFLTYISPTISASPDAPSTAYERVTRQNCVRLKMECFDGGEWELTQNSQKKKFTTSESDYSCVSCLIEESKSNLFNCSLCVCAQNLEGPNGEKGYHSFCLLGRYLQFFSKKPSQHINHTYVQEISEESFCCCLPFGLWAQKGSEISCCSPLALYDHQSNSFFSWLCCFKDHCCLSPAMFYFKDCFMSWLACVYSGDNKFCCSPCGIGCTDFLDPDRDACCTLCGYIQEKDGKHTFINPAFCCGDNKDDQFYCVSPCGLSYAGENQDSTFAYSPLLCCENKRKNSWFFSPLFGGFSEEKSCCASIVGCSSFDKNFYYVSPCAYMRADDKSSDNFQCLSCLACCDAKKEVCGSLLGCGSCKQECCITPTGLGCFGNSDFDCALDCLHTCGIGHPEDSSICCELSCCRKKVPMFANLWQTIKSTFCRGFFANLCCDEVV